MPDLVAELKKEHGVITETLNKVFDAGIISEEGQNLLLAAKSGLITHLMNEDERLYPVLNNAAESDDNRFKIFV